MIAIGAEFGGPELKGSVVRNAVIAAMNAASDARRENFDDGTLAWINPIFIVPGSISQPDFEGYKIGHFSAKGKGVVVVIAVPESAAFGDQVHQRIFSLLHGATQFAARFFAEKNIAFDHDECARVLRAVAERLRVDPNNLWTPRPQRFSVFPIRSDGVSSHWRRWVIYLYRSLLFIIMAWSVAIVALIVTRDFR